MDAHRFAAGYADRTPVEYAALSSAEWKRARDFIFSDPISQWSHFFSQIIDYTFDNIPVDPDQTSREINQYTGTLNRQLIDGIIRTTRGIAFHKPELTPQLNGLNFHSMNQEFGDVWKRLVSVDLQPSFTQERLVALQSRLSIKALELVHYRQTNAQMLRDKAQLSGLYPQAITTEQDTWLDSSLVGQITEFDAAVSLLETTRHLDKEQAENLIIVPAPPKYETFRGQAADFLAYDIAHEQAIGIQVKTNLMHVRDGEYDSRFIRFIDGVRDLGNDTLGRHPSGIGYRRPMPGLVSADFLLRHQVMLRKGRLKGMEGLQGRTNVALGIAHSLEPYLEYTNRASRAAHLIGPRIMKALEPRPEDDSRHAVSNGLDE